MRIILSSFATLLLAAACSQSPEPPASTSTADTAPAKAERVAPAPARAAANKPGVRFTSTPATIRRCEVRTGRTAVTLDWNALAAGSRSITIRIDDRKTFLTTSARGSATTGRWVGENTRFSLLDAKSGELLATLQVPFVSC